jgi:electron transfer flavoprotein beta subunit
MKILVGIKRVVDYAVKVRVSKGTVDLANVKQSMNPFCEVRASAVSIQTSPGPPGELGLWCYGPYALTTSGVDLTFYSFRLQ